MKHSLVLVASLWAATAAAQPYPSRPIEIVNSFAAGGTSDLNVRALQAGADKALGQPLVQTFRQSGGGIVGTSEVAGRALEENRHVLQTAAQYAFEQGLLAKPIGERSMSCSRQKRAPEF